MAKYLIFAQALRYLLKNWLNVLKKFQNKKIFIIQKESRMRAKKAEVNRLLGSNKKFKKQANWKPKYIGKKGFLNALRETFDLVQG